MAEIRYDIYPNQNNVGGVRRYIEQGIIPGHFLTAVITNDLSETFARADDTNTRLLHEIVRWFYNHAPSACWGSRERVQKWNEHRGLDGLREPREVPLMWKCPACGLRVRFLPPNLTESCPRCGGVAAVDFITKGGNVPWLNDCPGWGDDETLPGEMDGTHIPDDPHCRCRPCTERRAAEAEWRMEGDR